MSVEVEELTAGRELDARVHEEVMGQSLKPPREYAQAQVAWRYIASTGNIFRLRTGEAVPMPPGDTLRQPEGSDDPNDRYALHVAEFLGERIAAEVEAYRLEPPPYSTDIGAAWLVVEAMERRGFHWRIVTPFRPGLSHFAGLTPHDFTGWNGRPDHEAGGATAPEAICRAALETIRALKEEES